MGDALGNVPSTSLYFFKGHSTKTGFRDKLSTPPGGAYAPFVLGLDVATICDSRRTYIPGAGLLLPTST